MDRAQFEGVRIIEVPGLGEAALLVHARRQTILLMDSLLTSGQCGQVMEDVMAFQESRAAS